MRANEFILNENDGPKKYITGVEETEVFGVKAYNAVCMQCGWKSKRYSSLAIAQKHAKEHGMEHGREAPNLSESTLSETELYHVTKTDTVPNIRAKGITGMNPTNFKQAGNKKRYGKIGEVFAMTSKKDAVRWAANWEWQLANKFGSGLISIVTFKDDPNTWEIDDADPLSQAGNIGKWVKKKNGRVTPEQIIGSEPVTIDMIKRARL